PESVPVLFNRGMAALFLGRPAEAREDLRRAVGRLPEPDGWHHLGRLYLALAGGRAPRSDRNDRHAGGPRGPFLFWAMVRQQHVECLARTLGTGRAHAALQEFLVSHAS